jgi:hypothetical protein
VLIVLSLGTKSIIVRPVTTFLLPDKPTTGRCRGAEMDWNRPRKEREMIEVLMPECSDCRNTYLDG